MNVKRNASPIVTAAIGHSIAQPDNGKNSNGDFAPSCPPPPTVQQLLRLKQVRSITGLGRSTIYRWMEAGRFPKPVRLGPRSVAWIDYEIEAWVLQRSRCSYRESSTC